MLLSIKELKEKIISKQLLKREIIQLLGGEQNTIFQDPRACVHHVGERTATEQELQSIVTIAGMRYGIHKVTYCGGCRATDTCPLIRTNRIITNEAGEVLFL